MHVSQKMKSLQPRVYFKIINLVFVAIIRNDKIKSTDILGKCVIEFITLNIPFIIMNSFFIFLYQMFIRKPQSTIRQRCSDMIVYFPPFIQISLNNFI